MPGHGRNTYCNSIGDTLWDTVKEPWPEYYDQTITDTTFSVVKVNGFTIIVDGVVPGYRATDSSTDLVTFDSTYANSARNFLVWNYVQDTMHIEYHRIPGYNDKAMQYYEMNIVLHNPAPWRLTTAMINCLQQA